MVSVEVPWLCRRGSGGGISLGFCSLASSPSRRHGLRRRREAWRSCTGVLVAAGAHRRWWLCWLMRFEDAPGPGGWLRGGGFGRLCPDPVRCELGAGRRPMIFSSSQIQFYGAGGCCGYQRLWLRALADPSVGFVRWRFLVFSSFLFSSSCVCSCACSVMLCL